MSGDARGPCTVRSKLNKFEHVCGGVGGPVREVGWGGGLWVGFNQKATLIQW